MVYYSDNHTETVRKSKLVHGNEYIADLSDLEVAERHSRKPTNDDAVGDGD